MEILFTAAAGFALDLLLGDPERVPHPVVYMGRAISALEKMLRRLFPKTDKGELAAGAVLAVVMSAGTLTLTAFACFVLGKIHPALRWTAEIIWCWQALAMRGLRDETIKVRDKLNTDTLGSARRQVSRVVGRDTAALSPEGVTKAAVETVAENFSDGVIAPLFWMLIGGAPLYQIFTNRRVYLVSALRLLLLPVVLLLVLKCSGLPNLHPNGSTLLLITLLAASAPSASAITQMSQVFGSDAVQSSQISILSTIFSILTMPLVVQLYTML